ncbi:hypothetical protein [Escherichia coli]|nr:hypothetical protein [Escherichia coli]
MSIFRIHLDDNKKA